MAVDLLLQCHKPKADFVHTFSHDLESIIYVLLWVCVLYQAPNEVRRDKGIEQTCLKLWVAARTTDEIESLYYQKLGQLQSTTGVATHLTPYFAPLRPFIERLYTLIQLSRDTVDNPLTHAAVLDVLMDAFETVTEPEAFGSTNAKRAWRNTEQEPTVGSSYYSEGKSVRRRIV